MRLVYPFSTTFLDYPDPEDQAILVYFSGCEHDCAGCHSFSLQNYNNGRRFDTWDEVDKILSIVCRLHRTDKVILSGGDPLAPKNIQLVKDLLTNTCRDYMIYTVLKEPKIKNPKIQIAKNIDDRYPTFIHEANYYMIMIDSKVSLCLTSGF